MESKLNYGYKNNLGAITRTLPTDKDPVSGKLFTELEPNGAIINGYYYGFADEGLKSRTCVPAVTVQALDAAFAAAIRKVAPAGPSWQLYKSRAGGFQFIHPADWSVSEGTVPTSTDTYINIDAPAPSPPTHSWFRMQFMIVSNSDSAGPPAQISGGSFQKLDNALNLWVTKPTISSRTNGAVCPEMKLVNASMAHMSTQLPNGKHLTLGGGFCTVGSIQTPSYQQQLANEEWQTAVSIVQWVQWSP